ncbi:TPA: bifunctional hydroxymethylpyrimidine kinase/phosphomethylpyrimidine kinase [Streptococcus pneumoniae]|uniref:bifunctional hydroxymethylpyrimidine kinase/phosphomethylpyrimidine kinase n=1 Tax=Streptococcus pneumoniae TaxID=1313 RepID=UPI0005E8E9AB|nr:bifunctional hydroxymethylpyrimidine kinase/phosphomethylpyrimidine kinase [Streptococcus pneumoniae]KAA3422401.1 bifunctional hydroxymethylpyrimidine kinase/phosphomethylpyrimidine kinase [Streptococcus pneumoniae]MDS2358273.1 bifunctional hydroxymethylpyrimidine kinase/phosphomethylpyrimidine kinase [Streptococcus pneumoniae]MDS2471618.1 bifunctional hydroxymethylpyrimidine kinase/phosphomethylpyrimidine kinase [Streptococcus pneumoniae]MDS2715242.1 bifunctional hydroxymethylpyrimidine kin
MTYLPVALTIAGTDPSGGAGIMADLKSFQARDVYGMAVVTSLVAQNTRGVQLIEHVSPQMLKAQLESVFSDIPPQAVKTGMLATTEIMEIIQPYLKKLDCPYVLDPVMVATSGDALIDSNARDYLKTNLLPLATIITPNLPEAEEIVGFSIHDPEDMQRAGRLILKEFGPQSVVIKGGHLKGGHLKGGHLKGGAKDFLFTKNEQFVWESPRIQTCHTHGTGCTFAAVITAELAKGKSLYQAVDKAKAFITKAIQDAPQLGHGSGPVNHTTFKD